MRIYISARYAEREIARSLRVVLEADGHEIVSRWLDSESDTPEAKAAWSMKNLEDLTRAGVCVYMSSTEPGGGSHTEVGVAIALGIPVLILGHRESNCFHYSPWVWVCPTPRELRDTLWTVQQISTLSFRVRRARVAHD